MAAPITKNRRLTIYRKAFRSQGTITGLCIPTKKQLQGKWLQDNGFVCGQMVEVSYEPGKVVITLPDVEQSCSNEGTFLLSVRQFKWKKFVKNESLLEKICVYLKNIPF